jgi:hypothetical protein
MAELGYYDASLDETGRQSRLVAAAAEFAGEGLEGFWRGAGEVDPATLPPVRNPVAAARVRVPSYEQSAADRPRARLGGAQRAVAILAVLFGALVCVGTIARPWRPAHLVVFGVAAAFAVINAWWLPRRASAQPRAAWVVATVVGFFGGLALLGLTSAALR